MFGSFGKTTSIKISDKYTEIRKIVNSVRNNPAQTEIGQVSILDCLSQLYQDLNQSKYIINRLQKFLKDTDSLQLKTAHKQVHARIDHQKSIDLAYQKFKELSNMGKKKGQNSSQRIQTIMNLLLELNYGEISQTTVKQIVQIIKSQEHLQNLDKQTLEHSFNKILNYQKALKKSQGSVESILYQIRKFATILSNSKNEQYELKKQFQQMQKSSREILNPLFTQFIKLKSFHRDIAEQVLSQKAKIKLYRQTKQLLGIYEVRQSSIQGLIEEARYFKIQHERIKVVLSELAKMTKFSNNEQASQSWKRQRRTELAQTRQQHNTYLSTLFEHLLTPRSIQPAKNVNQNQLKLKRQNSQVKKYQTNIQKLQAQKDKQTKNLQQADRNIQQLRAELDETKEKLKDKLQLQQKVKQLQIKNKTLQTDTKGKRNQYSSYDIRGQTELKKKCQEYAQNQANLIQQIGSQDQKFQKLEQSALTKEAKIKELETKLKQREGSSEKQAEKQNVKLRKNISDAYLIIEQLRVELAQSKKQKKDLEKQISQVSTKNISDDGKELSNQNLAISALKQNDQINKQTIKELKIQNTRITAQMRSMQGKLEQQTTKCQELKKQTENNAANLMKLTSIEKQLIQSEQNYKDLNNLYLTLKQQLQGEKDTNKTKGSGQMRQKALQDLQFKLQQRQQDIKRFSQKFIKQTVQRDQQLTQLKFQIESNNSQMEKLRSTSDVSKLNQKTLDLEKELQVLVKQNSQLKITLQRKERQILEIKIMKIDQRI